MTLCLAYSFLLSGGSNGDTVVEKGVLHKVVREMNPENGMRWIYLQGTRIGAAESFFRQVGSIVE